MNLQVTLIIMSTLLVIMLVLFVWVIRLALNKKLVIESPRATSSFIKEPQSVTKPKYANSKLPNAEKKRYLKKILAALEEEKVYEQPDLTIKKLANQLEIPKYYLSQIINEQLGISFLDLINRYRVNAAKEKLQEERLEKVSILSIGKEVGFKAKSTFYAVFKKHTSQTPAAFRKAKLKQGYKNLSER